MSNQPKISVVIPTFNRAQMLTQAIESVLSQTMQAEIIVVNHGSTDETDQIVRKFGEKIIYVKRDNDFGPHFCWLEGVLHSKGDLIHLQYDDDWIEQTFLEECVDVMDADTGFVFSCAQVINDKTGDVHLNLFDEWLPNTGIYLTQEVEQKILSSLVSPAAAIYRKQLLVDALYQGRLPLSNNDYHGVGPDCFVTLLSMLRYPKVGYVKKPLAKFRMHSGSITIAAGQNAEKQKRINLAYAEVKRYYLEMKWLLDARKRQGLQNGQ